MCHRKLCKREKFEGWKLKNALYYNKKCKQPFEAQIVMAAKVACTCMLTPLEMRTRAGLKASLSSRICPALAASGGLSWSQWQEGCLSAESRCSSWLWDPGVLLQKDTMDKQRSIQASNSQGFHGKTSWGERDGYSLHSWKHGSCYNSVFQRWNPPLNTSRNIQI